MQQEKFGWTEVGGDFLTPDGKFQYRFYSYEVLLILQFRIVIKQDNT